MRRKQIKAKTERIVCQAAGVRRMSPKAKLGDVIASPQGRKQFRVNLAELAKKQKLHIRPESIPIHPDATLGHIHKVFTIAALPGEPGLPGDSGAWSLQSEEPSAPDPNEKAQKEKSAKTAKKKKRAKPR